MAERSPSEPRLSARAAILVHKPREEVFNAFVDPKIMRKFWLNRNDSGLRQGESQHWMVGEGDDVIRIDVHVRTIDAPAGIVLDWGHGDDLTTVTWTLEERGAGKTLLTIEETGFDGTSADILAHVLDSTGGFNQVVLALKAQLEHGATINIVEDHYSRWS